MTENSGRLAYDAYARAKGLDSRSWDELPDDDKAGWQLVAEEADRQAAQAGAAELLDTEASRPTEAESYTDEALAPWGLTTDSGRADVVTRSRRKS